MTRGHHHTGDSRKRYVFRKIKHSKSSMRSEYIAVDKKPDYGLALACLRAKAKNNRPTMNQQEIVEALEGYKTELEGILAWFSRGSDGWHINRQDAGRLDEIIHELRDIFGDHIVDGDQHSNQLAVYANYSISNWLHSPSHSGVEKIKSLVAAVIARVRRNPTSVKTFAQAARATGKKNPEFIERLAERLPTIIRELRNRREDRATLDVNDEYDLQDLLRSLLAIEFEDIRAEEWTPSYAGSSSRMDFLLPEIESVLETKMVRQGLTAKRLGEELIIDIARYEEHPSCRTLYCVVYDPEGRITNPRGIENDLERRSGKISVRVIIIPR